MKLIVGIAALVVVVVVAIVIVLVASNGSNDSNGGATPDDGRIGVPIELQGAENVGGLQLSLRYDPAVLIFESVTAGPLSAGALLESDSSNSGTVTIVLVHASGISGDGVLVNVRFEVVDGLSTTSTLELEQVEISDIDLRDLVFATTSGRIDGSTSSVEAPTINLR